LDQHLLNVIGEVATLAHGITSIVTSHLKYGRLMFRVVKVGSDDAKCVHHGPLGSTISLPQAPPVSALYDAGPRLLPLRPQLPPAVAPERPLISAICLSPSPTASTKM